MKIRRYLPLAILALIVLCGVALALPPIRERIAYRVNLYGTRIQYALHPPTEEPVFVPQAAVATIVQSTLQAASLQQSTPTPTLQSTATPLPPTPTAGPTATAIPASILLGGIRYENQHGLWNYCAPATLAMALSYWGWEGTRADTGKILKPFAEDLNVMPYEMADFAVNQAKLGAVVRYGGTLSLVKQLVAGGFPVVIEKGVMIKETTTGQVTWMGHYNVVVGYDDAAQEVTVRDSYYSPPQYPLDYKVKYDELQKEMQAFNYVFLVIYPPDQQDRLFSILGDYADNDHANRIAAQKASDEIASLTGVDKFFAWYNRGTSLVALQDYAGGAAAYDQAFTFLAAMPEDQVPKKIMRMIWYQTGPYFAYFYSGRYQDVIQLAENALKMPTSGPYLEESWYWKARAEYALGSTGDAIADLKQSLVYHPGFQPSTDLLQQMGAN